jgi:hypothetical protein
MVIKAPGGLKKPLTNLTGTLLIYNAKIFLDEKAASVI